MDPVCILKSPSQPHAKRHIVILCSTYISLWWDIHIPIHWYSCKLIRYDTIRYVYSTYVITSSHLDKNVQFLAIWGALGAFQWSNWDYLVSQLSFHPYLCTCRNFLRSNPKIWTKYHSFHTWGGGGGPGGGGGRGLNPRLPFFFYDKYDIMTVQICITRGKNN